MVELRLIADPKGIASMRDAVARECEQAKAPPEHAAEIVFVVEQLIEAAVTEAGRGRRRPRLGDVFVLVTVQSDATMLMVRDTHPGRDSLGNDRHRLLQERTTGWSTMAGRDGRTVWAEIARAPVPAPEPVRTMLDADRALRSTAAQPPSPVATIG